MHWWRQLCLNWRCLVPDLQKLSKVYVVPDVGEGLGLAQFRKSYPILWECIDAVFGLMMSNSRLCEQIHGMMRKVLRIGTGQDESDKHRAYSTGTDFELKEERRAMQGGAPSGHGGKKVAKKAKKHCATKAQVSHLSKQVCIG